MARTRTAKKELTATIRMTTDVRKRREPYIMLRERRRSWCLEAVPKIINEYADAGLDYFCAPILHPSAAVAVAGIRKFVQEIVGSY